jgi:hypothetical protein
MVFYDHLKEISVTPEFYFLGDIVAYFLGTRHRFHQLQVTNLLRYDVFIGAHL